MYSELTLEEILILHEEQGMTLEISNGKVINVEFPQ